ncbi:MAG: hypothetical protein FWG90_03090 [Oscillospiraceae bacterium]|nr:hypothetical protein [Oscillospiraceae bacterium]
MFFKDKKSPFSASAAVLGEKGFCADYLDALNADISCVKKAKELEKGKSYLCNALVIMGRLTEAYEVFQGINLKRLDKGLAPNLTHHVIFSLFARDKLSEADNIYREQNEIVLSEHTDGMRRTLAIHEYINGRYENAVTVLAKLLGGEVRFLDICLIKSMLRLDMYERASELSGGLAKYKGLSELGDEALRLEAQISEGFNTNRLKKRKKQ